MNHPQNTKIKSKRHHTIFENSLGKWPTVSPLLTTLMANLSKQSSNSLSQVSLSPMDGFQISLKTWKPRIADEITKTSISVCFANERKWMKRQHLSQVFSLLMKCLATKSRYTIEQPNKLTLKFSDLNSFNWKNAGEKFIRGESGLERLKCVFESYSDYKLNHWSVVKRTSLQPLCSLNLIKWLDYEFLTEIFFTYLELLNSGCSLSLSVAYTPVFMVHYIVQVALIFINIYM